jgi:hypothetical protein
VTVERHKNLVGGEWVDAVEGETEQGVSTWQKGQKTSEVTRLPPGRVEAGLQNGVPNGFPD